MISLRHAIPLQMCLVLFGVLPSPGSPPDAQAQQIERLIRQLGSERFEEREQAVKELVAVGAPALEPLRQALNSSDAEVVRRAGQCIPLIETNLKVAALVQRLKDKDPKVRADAALGLFEIGPAAKDAVPALLTMLVEEGDSHARNMAASAMGQIGPDAKVAIPKLVEILKDEKAGDDLRWHAAIILGNIGPAAQEAVPTLLGILETGRTRLKKAASLALGKIGGNHKGVVPALLKALQDTDAVVQGNAAAALGMLGREPAACVPALLEVLKRNRRAERANDPRYGVLAGLKRFGPDARPATPFLVQIASDEQEHLFVRQIALETLREIGPAAKEAIAGLRALVAQKRLVYKEAAQALEAIEGSAK